MWKLSGYDEGRIFVVILIVTLAAFLASGVALVVWPMSLDQKMDAIIVGAVPKGLSSHPEAVQRAKESPEYQALEKQKDDIVNWASVVAGVSFLAMILSAVGTCWSVLLSWRADRRQSEEFKLKIQQLERELAKSKEQHRPKRLDTAL